MNFMIPANFIPLWTLYTKEVMRFYPVVWAVGREAVIDDNIEGYKIPKGVAICLPILYMHYHPDYWDNPKSLRFLFIFITNGATEPSGRVTVPATKSRKTA